MRFIVIFKPTASKELQQLPKKDSDKILEEITLLESNPFPVGCKKLSGEENKWRIRIGDYRVLYEINFEQTFIRIYRIKHRKDVYR
jgi:mRNA interferase RelE/StbE